MKTPGGRLKFMRLAAGLTQVSIARAVHVTQPAVSQWEKNLWLPELDVQFALADLLGTTRAFIFGDSTKPVIAPSHAPAVANG
jgi:transcriptional regulator with XRE-family HTH domain